ncbi:MAG: ester cyclase [Solirubrobacteraceae bacterium]|nr:ester cyclase [Solirubrobacteraceae bacterium]
MTHQQCADLIDRLTGAWNAHDPEGVADCYAPDAVSRDITLTEALHGRAAIRNAAEAYLRAFPDLTVRATRMACEGDLICEEWRAQGTHMGDLVGLAPTGYHADMAGCNVIRLDANGQIASETTYTDAAGLYRQLHALPQLAHAAG